MTRSGIVPLRTVPAIGTVATTCAPSPANTETTYPVIGAPPDELGAFQVSWAEESPARAFPIRGAALARTGVTVFDDAEAAPVPIAFTAATVNRYAVPVDRPGTFALLPGPATVTVRQTVLPVPWYTETT